MGVPAAAPWFRSASAAKLTSLSSTTIEGSTPRTSSVPTTPAGKADSRSSTTRPVAGSTGLAIDTATARTGRPRSSQRRASVSRTSWRRAATTCPSSGGSWSDRSSVRPVRSPTALRTTERLISTATTTPVPGARSYRVATAPGTPERGPTATSTASDSIRRTASLMAGGRSRCGGPARRESAGRPRRRDSREPPARWSHGAVRCAATSSATQAPSGPARPCAPPGVGVQGRRRVRGRRGSSANVTAELLGGLAEHRLDGERVGQRHDRALGPPRPQTLGDLDQLVAYPPPSGDG